MSESEEIDGEQANLPELAEQRPNSLKKIQLVEQPEEVVPEQSPEEKGVARMEIPPSEDIKLTQVTQIDPGSDESVPEGPIIFADRYETVCEIGRGGMGTVYLAKDDKLKRNVAIKQLVLKSKNQQIIQRRFLREAQTIASLGHVNIVNVFDIGQDHNAGSGAGYIIMEYIPGPTIDPSKASIDPPSPVNLDQYIKAKGPMPHDLAEEIVIKLCSALSYAHKQGTLHRDIKPSNILLTEDLEPKLVDFGLARPIDISKTEEITLEGTMLGTPEYSAPEQWGDMKQVGPASDIYALGGVFWFILTGRIPRFFRESDVPAHLSPIIAKAMRQKPDERFAKGRQMGDAITAAIGGNLETNETSEENFQHDTSVAQDSFADQWACPTCTKFNSINAHYCRFCGTSGMRTCPACKGELVVNDQFCPHCGSDIKLSEESSGILLSARNHMNFKEYETALDAIKELGKSNKEADDLIKELREIILKRRNMLMEMEAAMRVFTIDKAVELAKELKEVIPGECLSETPDFEVVVKHSELEAELRKLLVESATRAHEDHNLQLFTESISALNIVFGEDVCGAINSQLKNILQELDSAMSNAGLALGMNCISKAQESIQQIPAWRNGELGDRLVKLSQTCTDLSNEREEYIDSIEAAIRTKEYSHALEVLSQMSKFRLPPDHSEIDPAQADLNAQERIIAIDKILLKTIDENAKNWVRHNDWETISNSIKTLKSSDSKNWHSLLERIRTMTNKEIVERYNRATNFEKNGQTKKAEKAWSELLLVPKDIMPSHLVQEAMDFEKRKQGYKMIRTKKMLTRGTILFCLLWPFNAYYIWWVMLKEFEQFGGTAKSFSMNMVPAICQLSFSVILAIVAKTPIVTSMQQNSDKFPGSPRLLMMAILASLSPLMFILYYVDKKWVSEYTNGFPWTLAALAIWLLIDLTRSSRIRFPARVGLSVSWLLCIPVYFMFKKMELNVYTLWPALSLVHTALFIGIQVIDHTLYNKKKKTEKKVTHEAVEENIST
ncbi:MAG: protein kinase [Lentisphaeria bacterium]|nr:protein kinase [Lentisphaeria bacterium]